MLYSYYYPFWPPNIFFNRSTIFDKVAQTLLRIIDISIYKRRCQGKVLLLKVENLMSNLLKLTKINKCVTIRNSYSETIITRLLAARHFICCWHWYWADLHSSKITCVEDCNEKNSNQTCVSSVCFCSCNMSFCGLRKRYRWYCSSWCARCTGCASVIKHPCIVQNRRNGQLMGWWAQR